jgi:aspartyl-tRNA(Asn)/glutamyl-tRNA(Gln) amidotransferase subunit C
MKDLIEKSKERTIFVFKKRFMKVNDELIDKLAKLAKIEFDDKSKKEIKNDMDKMLKFVDKLNELDTKGIEPLIFMSEEINVFRADIARKTITQKEALKNVPEHNADYIMVPTVVSKDK